MWSNSSLRQLRCLSLLVAIHSLNLEQAGIVKIFGHIDTLLPSIVTNCRVCLTGMCGCVTIKYKLYMDLYLFNCVVN